MKFHLQEFTDNKNPEISTSNGRLLMISKPFFFIILIKSSIANCTVWKLSNEEKEKIPLIISVKHRPDYTGFFSNFFLILAGIDKADKQGQLPVIDMESIDNIYKENYPVNGTQNSWEYFFYQPTHLSLQTARSMNHLNIGKMAPLSAAKTTLPDKTKLKRGRELIAKYIRIKPFIIDEVIYRFPEEFNPNILGIHVRGTDRRRGTIQHLMTASADQYLKQAIGLDARYQFKKIFLACDEIETLDLFKSVFGTRLIYNEAYRVPADSDLTVHHTNTNQPLPRRMHKYLLGKEVLLDALMLARCGHFLCGPSTVAHAVMFFSKQDQIIHEVPSPGMYMINQR